jgi:hypothetical protein
MQMVVEWFKSFGYGRRLVYTNTFLLKAKYFVKLQYSSKTPSLYRVKRH